jgi:pyridoxamine 5'-phosphate oxidase
VAIFNIVFSKLKEPARESATDKRRRPVNRQGLARVSVLEPEESIRKHRRTEPTAYNRRMASADPITEFLNAVERARAHQVDTAPVALATADAQGRPSARMVLLRGADARGFAFFTNFNSRKGRELSENPHASLCFHWVTLDEQIRIEGPVERLPDSESDAYFASRPRGSQLGAWASDQSQPLPSRESLEERYREVERRFGDGPVPRPPFWGGFRLVPTRIEFWYGRPDRLHDRVVYIRDRAQWRIERLYP